LKKKAMSNGTDDGKGDTDPCPLQYCDFKMVDHKTMCPFYTSLLTRSAEQGITPEDLHLLQSDLETLLAGANRRIRQIDSETKLLVDWIEKKDKKSVRQRELEILNSLQSPFKRSRPASEEKGAKRQKFEESRSASPAPVGRSKSKQSASSEGSQEEETFAPSVKTKSDAPNRFWSAVEPYCADISVEDQKFLEQSLKVPDDEQEYFKIPPLGRHYAEKWAQEDLLDEQEEGCRMQDKKLRGTLTSTNSENTSKTNEEKSMLKKADSAGLPEEDLCPFGPLTQRLVSALIEENIIAPIPEQNSGSGSSDSAATTRSGNNPPRTPTKAPHVPHTRTLEARIREELVFQGLLDADDQTDEDNDDEVLTELKRHQNELRVLMAKNRQQKMELTKLTQEEIRRQELKHRAQVADAEVMEWFRKMMACKQKRKSPTKKEKEAAWKALREREAILRVLGNS